MRRIHNSEATTRIVLQARINPVCCFSEQQDGEKQLLCCQEKPAVSISVITARDSPAALTGRGPAPLLCSLLLGAKPLIFKSRSRQPLHPSHMRLSYGLSIEPQEPCVARGGQGCSDFPSPPVCPEIPQPRGSPDFRHHHLPTRI